MKKEIIEGCLATNFGANNYNCGMEAIISKVQRVKR